MYVRILSEHKACVIEYCSVTAQVTMIYDTGDEYTKLNKQRWWKLRVFIETKEMWEAYIELLKLYFEVNNIELAKKNK